MLEPTRSEPTRLAAHAFVAALTCLVLAATAQTGTPGTQPWRDAAHFDPYGQRCGVCDKTSDTVRMQARDLRRTTETRVQVLGVERDMQAQLLSHGRTPGVQQRHYEWHNE